MVEVINLKVFVCASVIADASRALEGKLRQRGWHPGVFVREYTVGRIALP